jgi:putative DNA primase/helicase
MIIPNSIRQLEDILTNKIVHNKSKPNLLYKIAEDFSQKPIFRDSSGNVWVAIDNINLNIESREFQEMIEKEIFTRRKTTISKQDIKQIESLIKGFSKNTAQPKDFPLRVSGSLEKGKIIYNLGNKKEFIITSQGWEICSDGAEGNFAFYDNIKTLPVPQRGGYVAELLDFINVSHSEAGHLLICWIVGAMLPMSAYPILSLSGSHDSGKTTASRFVRNLIDPNNIPPLILKDEASLKIDLEKLWIPYFDNVSSIPKIISDILCCVSTGGGFASRKLYSDNDLISVSLCRPMLFNSIQHLPEKEDLASRFIVVNLAPISRENRRTPESLEAVFQERLPFILGAVFDVISHILRVYPTLCDQGMTTRFSQLEKVLPAVEEALAYPSGTLCAAFIRNFEAEEERKWGEDLLLQKVQEIFDDLHWGRRPRITTVFIQGYNPEQHQWQGNASTLLQAIQERLSGDEKDQSKYDPDFPKHAGHLTKRLKALSPLLRKRGIIFTPDCSVGTGNNKRRVLSIKVSENH